MEWGDDLLTDAERASNKCWEDLYAPIVEGAEALRMSVPSTEEMARIIDPDAWRIYDTGILAPDHPGALALIQKSTDKAQAILEAFHDASDRKEAADREYAYCPECRKRVFYTKFPIDHVVMFHVRCLVRHDARINAGALA